MPDHVVVKIWDLTTHVRNDSPLSDADSYALGSLYQRARERDHGTTSLEISARHLGGMFPASRVCGRRAPRQWRTRPRRRGRGAPL